jgi:hypothetical protein
MSCEPSFPYSSVAVAAQRVPRAKAISKTMAMGVLSLVDPEAGVATDLKDATATVAAEVVWTATDLKGAGLTKLGAHGARALTFTTAGATPADAPAYVDVASKDIDGTALTETLLLSQIAGEVTSAKCYSGDDIVLTFPAADGVDATIAVGIADKFGLPCKIKSRAGYPVRFVEIEDGDIVSTGGGSATATNQATTIPRHEVFAIPVAPATSLGTIAESAASASASTQPGYPGTLDVAFVAGWEGGDITVNGKDPLGASINEVFTANPGSTVNGVKNFAFIDASGIVNSSTAGAADLATVQTGASLGITTAGTPTFLKLVVNGADEAIAAQDTTNKTFQPTTAPDALKSFSVWYTSDHTHVQDAHSHSGSEAAVADVATSLPYGSYTPATTPDGSVDFVLVFEQDPDA